MNLNVHAIRRRSRANGPGVRTVIWFQGCSLKCPGCFNPDTHSHEPRLLVPVEGLVQELMLSCDTIEGLTLSGGEPLEQLAGLMALLTGVRERTDLSVILSTGWDWAQVLALPDRDALLACVDVVLAGPYEADRHLASGLRGSANKTMHFLTNRYSEQDILQTPTGEVTIDPDGEVTLSGVDPLPAHRPGD